MVDPEDALFDDEIEVGISAPETESAKQVLRDRCSVTGLTVDEFLLFDETPALKVGMKCGRDLRWLILTSTQSILDLLSVPFEQYVFLADHEAICSYEDGVIEGAVRPVGGFAPSSFVYRKLFALEGPSFDAEQAQLVLEPPDKSLPRLELSFSSDVFKMLARRPPRPLLTLKLVGCQVSRHDDALTLLKKAADSMFFQIDLLSDIPLSLERERQRFPLSARKRQRADLAAELRYPHTEFDDAPISLYWYGRSAIRMPLLQFLAFYQVIEFYFPIYSQANAQHKIKAILKDPTFRGDRDTDISRLLSAITLTRSGDFGDERSQLRATLAECVEPEDLRAFLDANPARKAFYSAKGKSDYHKIPLSNPEINLISDTANRVSDIRCKIVHTKSDSQSGEIELLLPFSKEAERLFHDVELMQYLAQAVLIAGSAPFRG